MAESDRQTVVYKLITEAGLPFSLDSFDNRLRIQKTAYLLVAMGAPLDYHYNWYLRGPYSPSLAKDLFAVAANIESARERARLIQFGPGARRTIDALKETLRAKPADYPTDVIWFEALASVAFLKRRGAEERAIAEQLGKEKALTPQMVRESYRAVAELGV